MKMRMTPWIFALPLVWGNSSTTVYRPSRESPMPRAKRLTPPKPLESNALVPHVVSASLAKYYRLLPHKPPVGLL